MRKRFSVGLSTLLILVLGASAALAATATLSPTGLQEVTTFPHTSNVNVTFTHDSPNVCKGQTGTDWSFEVLDGEANVLQTSAATPASRSGEYVQTDTSPAVCVEGESETEIIEGVVFPEPGTYTLKATLASKAGASIDLDEDEELILELEQELTLAFPAAPSVAARIFAANDVPARYGSGKSGGNHISDVAAEMNETKGTDFQGVAKTDVADYKAQVCAFLNDPSGKDLELDCDA